MAGKLKIATTLGALICLSQAFPGSTAFAITAEVAKKCSALSSKAFPPRVVGNPAAGVQNGTFQDFRNYFNKCVANGGNPPEETNKQPSQAPDEANKQPSQAPNDESNKTKEAPKQNQ